MCRRAASRVSIGGPQRRDVLAKGCPLDFHPRVIRGGACAQSLVGHVNALVYRHDAAPTFMLMVARSFARDAWQLLCLSSAQYGYDVVAPRPLGESR